MNQQLAHKRLCLPGMIKEAIARAKITNDPTDVQTIKDAENGNKEAQDYLRSKFAFAIAVKEIFTLENFADELPESTFYED